jgi:23S rRNA (pseudouridine1915-N3)-methyltransferase
MRFQILTPGKSKQDFLSAGESEYFKRVNQIARIELVELPQSKAKTSKAIIEEEGQFILKKVRPGTVLIALDERGKSISSPGLATLFEQEFSAGLSDITFVIGGAYGLSQDVRNKAKHIISLSALTFTAQFARLILAEQIYRALAIRNGLPYHKE